MDNSKLTPLMQQYWDIKSGHQDKILLFRMGDFYEMFFDDAVKAAPILSIALTSRNKSQGQDVPMCGVPYHSIGPQINKLLKANLKVAICDQVENPSEAKGIVKRAVTRIVTPGLVFDSDTLDSNLCNYLVGILKVGNELFDIAAVDASTGEVLKAEKQSLDVVLNWVQQNAPKEFLFENDLKLPFDFSVHVVTYRERKSLNIEDFVLDYIRETQGEEITKTLKPPQDLQVRSLHISATSVRQLEILRTSEYEKDGSLVSVLDRTRTPMGARLLRRRLMVPFCELKEIRLEHEAVASFMDSVLRKTVRAKLSEIGDMERKIVRLSSPLCNARDLRALGQSLAASCEVLTLCGLKIKTSEITHLCDKIRKTLKEELPHSVRDGEIINSGINLLLDEYIELSQNGQAKLSELENRERSASGIQSLKIKYNNVFGYSFEITKANLDKVPKHFVRRQTLAQAERFVTQELSDLEEKILSSQQKRCDLELDIFQKLKAECLDKALVMLEISQEVASQDVRQSWAEISQERRFVRPQFDQKQIVLMESRHPVVEALQTEPFIANDIILKSGECLLLTGPNMAGKSTLMRQVAVAAIMAQSGGYVSASQATLPLFEHIFTRIGASDNLSRGLSTFKVEMLETAHIVKNANENSLIILDEIGRGTSTYDGMSLAQAILEHFVDKVRAFTFFATHYHELTEIEANRIGVINAHMAIQEYRGTLVFLRKLMSGPANRSYGIEVAKQSGLPSEITERARMILKGLVVKGFELKNKQMSLLESPVLENEKFDDLISQVKSIQLNSLTPLEALNRLAQLQSEASKIDA